MPHENEAVAGFWKAVIKGSVAVAEKKGMAVVLQEAYPKGKGDFAALAGKVKAAHFDVLGMVVANAGDSAAITRQMRAGTRRGSVSV